MSSFPDIAYGILQESIKSAIFIDDNVLLPYEKDDGKYQNHSDLLAALQNSGCSLAYHRYSVGEKNNDDFLFSNRDLLILDWELANDEPKYVPALELLEKAVNKESLHFCIIYTSTDKEQISDKILLPLLRYFSFGTSCPPSNAQNLFKDFKLACENVGNDYNDVLGELTKEVTTLVLYNADQGQYLTAKENISGIFKKFFPKEEFREIVQILTKYELKQLTELAISVYYSAIDSVSPYSSASFGYSLRLHEHKKDEWTVYLNNTIIVFGNKNEIQQAQNGIFKEVCNYILDEHNIFLTLLGLEMRNGFRKKSGFIGKELDSIEQMAFLYHHQTLEPKEAFYEFLKEVWTAQATSFLHEETPKLYDSLVELLKKPDVIEGLRLFSEDVKCKKPLIQQLGKLNTFYNQLIFNPKAGYTLRFGDVFSFDGKHGKEFMLCLTPLCDCAEPDKIKRQYYFAKSQELPSLEKGLLNSETWYCSFLEIDSEVICINWGESKPFTLHIPDPDIEKINNIYYLGDKITLTYVATLKENFAQRIANKAFNYPLRVGVSLAKIK